jgi:hypothetical protein
VVLLSRPAVSVVRIFEESLCPELIERMFLPSVVKCASRIPMLLVPMAEIDSGENNSVGLDRPLTKVKAWDDGGLERMIVSSFASIEKADILLCLS